MARNRSRAARRNQERQRRNAAAVESVTAISDVPPKRRLARTKTVLELLEQRGSISIKQKRAGDRLARDYYASNTLIGRMIGSYAPRAGTRAKWQDIPDTPLSVTARESFDRALDAVSPWGQGILVHVCVTDLSPTSWGPLNGKAAADGPPLLRAALDILAAHYNKRGGTRERLDDPRGAPGR
jgi:hypothetical protein